MDTLKQSLEQVLADSYALYLKTQNYHWNVESCCFYSLHKMFEEQYEDLAGAVDACAEHLRGLGHKVDASLDVFSSKTSIGAGKCSADSWGMLKDLLEGQLAIEKTLIKAHAEASEAGDCVVTSFLEERMTIHRKNAWFIRSSLASKSVGSCK